MSETHDFKPKFPQLNLEAVELSSELVLVVLRRDACF